VNRLTAGFSLLGYALIVGALIVGFTFLVGRQDLSQPERMGLPGGAARRDSRCDLVRHPVVAY